MMTINYQRLEYFLKIAGAKSITAAAEDIHISQQALSHQLSLLEKELGTTLFYRSRTGLTLTSTGEELYQRLAPAYENLCNQYQRFTTSLHKEKNHLSIGYFDGFSFRQYVSPIINELIANNPLLSIDFEANNLVALNKLLEDKKYDLIITAGRHREHPGRESLWLTSTEMKLFLSEKHPFFQKERLDISDLEQCDLLVYSDYEAWEERKWAEDLPVRRRIICKNYDTYFAYLEEGRGIALMGEAPYTSEYQVKFYPLPDGHEIKADIWAVFHKESIHAALLRKII